MFDDLINEKNDIDETSIDNNYSVFDIEKFAQELYSRSFKENKDAAPFRTNITGHTISDECIMYSIKRIRQEPIKEYANSWLPVKMRMVIGQAIHDFIQSSSQFTEIEPKLKVPSIRFNGLIDGLIGPTILNEIKSISYKDYVAIFDKKNPRKSDLLQSLVYKYVLENHLEECKKAVAETDYIVPKEEKYNIKKINLIYVAHDIDCTDIKSINAAKKRIESIKKNIGKNNHFYNFLSMTIECDENIKEEYDFVIRKLQRLNSYLDNNKFPDKDDEFIDRSNCFFCNYKDNCNVRKK